MVSLFVIGVGKKQERKSETVDVSTTMRNMFCANERNKMSKCNWQTSMQFNEEDFFSKEKLKKAGVSIIDTWRRGADEYLREMLKKKLTK